MVFGKRFPHRLLPLRQPRLVFFLVEHLNPWFVNEYIKENNETTLVNYIGNHGTNHGTWKTGWWFGTCFFPHIGNVIIPIDFHIFQRGLVNHQPEEKRWEIPWFFDDFSRRKALFSMPCRALAPSSQTCRCQSCPRCWRTPGCHRPGPSPRRRRPNHRRDAAVQGWVDRIE